MNLLDFIMKYGFIRLNKIFIQDQKELGETFHNNFYNNPEKFKIT